MDERPDGYKRVMEANASYIPCKPPWYAVVAVNRTTGAVRGSMAFTQRLHQMGVEVLDRASSTDLIKRAVWGDCPSLKLESQAVTL